MSPDVTATYNSGKEVLLVLGPQTRLNPLADTFLKPTIVLTSQEPVSEVGIWINHIYGIADKSTLRR
jgi:hypothetical protein